MLPARWVYNKRPDEPATQVAILRGLVEDLYVTMGKHDVDGGTVALKLVSNPLVDWMWLGFLLMAAATILAPARRTIGPRCVTRPLFAEQPDHHFAWCSRHLGLWRVVARMPLGAPLVVLGLGGLGLGLTALALYRVLYPLLRRQATTSAERRASIEEELRARLAAGMETTE